MTYTKAILGTALLLSSITTGAHAMDKLKLSNGDVLSGTINSFSTQGVSITTAYGEFKIPVTNIGGIESPRYYLSDLAAVQPPQPITPVTPIETAAPAIETVQPAIEKPDETGLWGAKWSGSMNVGTELETGNSDSFTLNIDADTQAKWDKHRLGFGADYDYEENDDVLTSDDRELSALYDYFFAKKWFWDNQLKLEQEKVDELDLRATFTSGLGYQFYDHDDLSLKVTFGPGYEHEDYANDDATDELTVNWTLDYEQGLDDDFIRLFHNHDLSSPADELSSYLFESESGVKIPLRNNIVAKGAVEFDWNNDPADGEVEDDTTYGISLGYEW